MGRRKSARIDKQKTEKIEKEERKEIIKEDKEDEVLENETEPVEDTVKIGSSPITHCSHVQTCLGKIQRDVLVEAQKSFCVACGPSSTPRWLCLHPSCLAHSPSLTFCGSKENNHVGTHYQEHPEHCIVVNPSNCRLFCFACAVEIDKEHNSEPISFETRRALMPLKRGRKKSSRKDSVEAVQSKESKTAPRQLTSPRQSTRGPPIEKEALQNRPIIKEMEDGFEDDFPRGLTGLYNLGNTCYFNAAIQALSSCPPFSDFFRDKGDLRAYSLRDPLVSNQLALLFQRIWGQQRETAVSPKALLARVRDMFPQFRGWNQQDSQELVRCLLELVHRELGQPVYSYEENLSLNHKFPRRHSSTSSADSDVFETADSGWSSDGDTPSTSNDSRAEKALGRGNRAKGTGDGMPGRGFDPVRWKSIVTDVFDGSIESSVTCLTCNNVSTTTEAFQDLSLPIPTKEQLDRLAEWDEGDGTGTAEGQWSSWWSWLGYISSYFVSPTISLEDCFATFFSPDRLIGDDMYSCEKCKKLRNGMKACRIRRAPEVLSIHIKRFRHDSYSSSKVSTKVAFPLTDLDISPFCVDNEDCKYDLCGFITHEGSGSDSGHYLAYCRNEVDGNWYEFDDSTVTKLDSAYVLTKEAYVLFYQKKSTPEIEQIRNEVAHFISPTSTLKSQHNTYISTEWLLRLNTFSNPGPVCNYAFLCHHGHILPRRAQHIGQLCTAIPTSLAQKLYQSFGGGPRVSELHYCIVCEKRWRWLAEKKLAERKKYKEIDDAIRATLYSPDSNCLFINHLPPCLLSKAWFRVWERFVTEPIAEPPGPIDNSVLLVSDLDGKLRVKPKSTSQYIRIHREHFLFFHACYGGGPEVFLVDGPQPDEEELSSAIAEAEVAVTAARREAEERLKEEERLTSNI